MKRLLLMLVLFAQFVFAQTTINILNFQADNGFQHSSKPQALRMVELLGQRNQWNVVTSIDTALITMENLQQFDVIVFNNNCGTDGRIFSDQQQQALQRYIHEGGGFVGIHCAGAIWHEGGQFQVWYEKLIGTRLVDHPQVQNAKLILEDQCEYCKKHLPEEWIVEDEWHRFAYSPRPNVYVLLSLDENSYEGVQKMGGDHPFTWYQYYNGGRSFFTSLGHTIAIYENENYQKLVEAGILWASGQNPDIFCIPTTRGLILDLDANHSIELEDSNRVSSWENQVHKNGVRKFTKQDEGREIAGSGRPTLLLNSIDAGGNNTVIFHRQELVNDNEYVFDHLTTGSGYTWFSVMAVYDQVSAVKDVNSFFGNLRNSNIDEKGQYEGFWGGLSDDNRVWMGTRNAITFGRWDENNPLIISPEPLIKGQYYIIIGRMGDGNEIAKLELFINQVAPVATGFVPVNTGADPSKMSIGQERDAINHPGFESFEGEISRFLLFERPLSDQELAQTLGYLKQKYGIK